MHPKNSDIFVALGTVLLNIVWMLLPFTMLWIGVLLALPMVFFVPGYMLTEILTHRRGLNVLHRLTLSLGLSLSIDIFGGFLLNVLPIGLHTQSWIVLLSCSTLVFALAVLYLRRGMILVERDRQRVVPIERDRQQTVPMGGQGDRKGLPYTSRSMFWGGVRSGIVFAFALALVVLSLLYAARGVAEQPRPGFTQLWMLPSSHTTQHCVVHIGIRSFENGSVTYHAAMTINRRQTMSWSALVLAPSQVWERSIAVTPTTKKAMFVEVRLYRNDKPTVMYREVHMTLHVESNIQKVLYCGG